MTQSFAHSGFIPLWDETWLARQRVAGKCAAACLSASRKLIQEEKSLTGRDVESLCVEILTKYNCQPTFHLYRGFPGKICLSVNKNLVHGIPTNQVLLDGDVIKVDLGATFEEAIADCAITVIKGTPRSPSHVRMVEACQIALTKAISRVQAGARWGVIGNAISRLAKEGKFGLVTTYGGHAIGHFNGPHAWPHVGNMGQPQEGIHFQPGMTLAIEPLLTTGAPTTWVGPDQWSVMTPDVNAHFEHSIFIHPDHVEVLTQEDNEN